MRNRLCNNHPLMQWLASNGEHCDRSSALSILSTISFNSSNNVIDLALAIYECRKRINNSVKRSRRIKSS